MFIRKSILRYAAAAILSLASSCIATAQVQPRIAGEINNEARVKIAGTAVPLSHSVDTGRLSGDQRLGRMVLMLTPSPAQEAAAKKFVAALHDPSSPSFHKWLTPAQFGEKFGVAQQDASLVQQWLESQGLTVHEIATSRRFIVFSGSVQQVEQAFSTEMHSYTLSGKPFIANSREISIPSALTPVVKGVVRLHSDPSSAHAYMGGKVHYDRKTHQFTGGSGDHFLTPADFATIYNLNPLYQAGIDGTGQTIAIVGRSDIDLKSVQDYRSMMGLPAKDPQIIVNGDDPGQTGDLPEAMLDVTWSGAVAPNAQIVYVVSQSNFSDGVDVSASYIVDHNLAPVMSTSYGSCEASLGTVGNAFYNALWQQAAAQGTTSFVSAGDNGGAGCDDPGAGLYAFGGPAVSGIASTPYNVAVGGTQFDDTSNPSAYWSSTNDPTTLASALGYIPEAVWNQSSNDPNAVSLWAGSGGVSSLYLKPAWQSAPGVPADGYRDVPDISLSASSHDGYLVCMFDDCAYGSDYLYYFGGTSASSPSAAGIMALVNQKLGGPQGNANYVFYRLANTQPSVYHDTTTGNNMVPDPNGQYTVGYDAGPGYDLATGLGSVDANALVNNWSTAVAAGYNSAATLALAGSASTVQHGTPLSFQATVTCSSAAGGCPAPGGDVALQATSGGGSSLGVGAGSLSPSSTGSTALIQTSKIPGGTYAVTARYGGDANFNPTTSASVNVTITPEPSQTVLGVIGGGAITNAPLSVGFGLPLQIGIIVAGNSGSGYPSGQISLSADGQPATTDSFNAALGQFSPSPLTLNYGENSSILSPTVNTLSQASTVSYLLPCQNCNNSDPVNATQVFHAGKHTLTATYPGDASFGASASAYSFTVTKADTLIADFFPNGDAVVNVPVHLAGQVVLASNGFAPYTGTVTITDITTGTPTPLGSAPLSMLYGGSYDIPVTFTSGGNHTLVVSFSGDSDTNPSSATEYNVRVQSQDSNTYVSLSTQDYSSTAIVGSSVTFVAQVGSGVRGYTPTGTIAFTDGTTPLGTANLGSNGTASLVVTTLAGGTHNINASYSGDTVLSAAATYQPWTENIQDYTMQAQPATLSFAAGSSGTTTISVIPLGGSTQTVTLSCGTLPSNLSCSFSPASVTLDGTDIASVSVTVTSTATSARLGNKHYLWGVASTLAVAWFLVPFSGRSRRKRLLGLCMLLALTLVGIGCGGSSTPKPTTPQKAGPTTTVISITATGGTGTTAKTTPLVVTVN